MSSGSLSALPKSACLRILRKGKTNAPMIVAFHGWASNGDVWAGVAKQLPDYAFWVIDLPGFYGGSSSVGIAPEPDFHHVVRQCIDTICENVALLGVQSAPDIFLMGWSLGGQFAVEVARAKRLNVAGLITLAFNPCFVACDDWLSAMAADTFKAFCELFAANPNLAIKRFSGLQAIGANNTKLLRQSMTEHLPSFETELKPYWSAALSWLKHDTRSALAMLDKPQLHLLAKNDALVPYTVELAKFGEIQILKDCSHCLPLEVPDHIARAVTVFIKTHSGPFLDKKKVAVAFSGAAKKYDSFAHVQKKVAQQLLGRIESSVVGRVILDLGSGTGNLTDALARRGALVVAADIAEGMLAFAKTKKQPEFEGSAHYLASDAEQMAIADESFHGIVSSLAVQWCASYPQLFKEIYRQLKPGGWVALATLGPKTLQELKMAWQAVDDCVHVNAFASAASIDHAATASGLEIVSFEVEREISSYTALMPLMQEIKSIGAHNVNRNAHQGLMTKAQFSKLQDAYPVELGDDGARQFNASYDVYYYLMLKPQSF